MSFLEIFPIEISAEITSYLDHSSLRKFAQVSTLSNQLALEAKRNQTLDEFINTLKVHSTLIVKRLDSNNVFLAHPWTTNPNSRLAYYHLDLDKMIKTNISEEVFMHYIQIPSNPTLNN